MAAFLDKPRAAGVRKPGASDRPTDAPPAAYRFGSRESGTSGTLQMLLRVLTDKSGNIAVLSAVVLPVMLGTAAISVDFVASSGQRSNLQAAADAAAVASARELAMGHSQTISAVAKAIAEQALSNAAGMEPATVDAQTTGDGTGVEVVISQTTKSYFPGITGEPTTLTVSATARATGPTVCVLALETSESGAIRLGGSARLTADRCAAFSNSASANGVVAASGSRLTADLICSSGGFDGTVSSLVGTRIPDCPQSADPLANRPAPPVGSCTYLTKLVIDTDRTLDPGVYCGGIEIRSNSTVTLTRGIYVIKDGMLTVHDTSALVGQSVGLYFAGKDSYFEFTANSKVELSAPTDGVMAGILIFGDREAPDYREYKITSNNARKLLGTIYLPKGYFTINASNSVADQSAYTVIVARRIELGNSPDLILRSDYHRTDVPVPAGLGPASSITLTN